MPEDHSNYQKRCKTQIYEAFNFTSRYTTGPATLTTLPFPCNHVQVTLQRRRSDNHVTAATARSYGAHDRTTTTRVSVTGAFARGLDVPIALAYQKAVPLCTARTKGPRRQRAPLRGPQPGPQPGPQTLQTLPHPPHPPLSRNPIYTTQISRPSLPSIPWAALRIFRPHFGRKIPS